MGLNWLSALVLLSGITAKLLVFWRGGKKRRGLFPMALSEVSFFFFFFLLPREQTSTWHITQDAAVPWVCSEFVPSRDTEVSDGEMALCLKTSNQRGLFVGWTSRSWLFIHAEHVRFCWKRHFGMLSTITVHTIEVISPWCGALGLALRSKPPSSQMKLILAASLSYRIFKTLIGLRLPHAQPRRKKMHRAAADCFFFLHTTCQSRGRKRLPVGPRGALAVFHVWGTNWWWAHTSCMYIFTHMHMKHVHTHAHTHVAPGANPSSVTRTLSGAGV